MIDKQNRLRKLAAACATYAQFERVAIARSSWFLAPYVVAGEQVTRPWLGNFWNVSKRKV